mgnify:CR=1 FL=1
MLEDARLAAMGGKRLDGDVPISPDQLEVDPWELLANALGPDWSPPE